MCGIVGFLSTNKESIPELGTLRAMRESLSHRGPDDFGEYWRSLDEQGPFVFLGHRRLSIIDLAGGHQPISNEEETIQVMLNGEIYNFRELRLDLEKRGHRFKTNSDTEVIAHAYEEFEEGCFQELNGMFAIALWDDRKKRLVLARDRLGKKPLYYSCFNHAFLFGSELKSLMADSRFPREVDLLSFAKYLFYEFIPAPETIFRNTWKLLPASYLVWEKGKMDVREYWSPFSPGTRPEGLDEESAVEKMMALLRESVRRRLISDVPLGVFLSGGVDSSAVAALAQEAVPGKVKTFSIGFEDPTFDESKYARLASRHLGTEHHEQVMSPQDLLDIIPHLPEIVDEPMADASILPTFLLSRFTRKHVKVALGGDGGDELFAGYPTYLAHRLADRYERFLRPLHPAISFLGNRLPVSDDNISFDFKVKKFLSGIGYPDMIRNSIWLGSFGPHELEKIFSPAARRSIELEEVLKPVLDHSTDFPFRDKMTRLQYLDLRLYLQESILVKVDRASMVCSLEVRAPFLDRGVVEFVMGLPSRMKLRGWTSKYLLKRAMGNVLPKEIIARKKKGFGVPIAKWVKGPLKDLFSAALEPSKIRQEGLLDGEYVSLLLQTHLLNQRDNRKLLWTLLVWELWFDRYRPSL